MESSGTTTPASTMELEEKKSSLSLIGGIFLVLAGVAGLVQWALVIVNGNSAFMGIPPEYQQLALGIFTICAGIEIVFSLIALLGGIMAIQRKMWALALVGSILGLFTLGFLIGSILALVALILIAMSKKEFH